MLECLLGSSVLHTIFLEADVLPDSASWFSGKGVSQSDCLGLEISPTLTPEINHPMFMNMPVTWCLGNGICIIVQSTA